MEGGAAGFRAARRSVHRGSAAAKNESRLQPHVERMLSERPVFSSPEKSIASGEGAG